MGCPAPMPCPCGLLCAAKAVEPASAASGVARLTCLMLPLASITPGSTKASVTVPASSST